MQWETIGNVGTSAASGDSVCSMAHPHVAESHIASHSAMDPARGRTLPASGLADLPGDVLADIATRLTVADVGILTLVSRGVRDSVLANDHLWAMQYCNRWVLTRHHALLACYLRCCSTLSTVARCGAGLERDESHNP